MRVVGQGADQIQALLHRQAGQRSHHEAGPAAHRVRAVRLHPCQRCGPQVVQQKPGRQGHAPGDSGGGLRLHQRQGLRAHLRRRRPQQRGKIHRQAFGQRRGRLPRIQRCQPRRGDVLYAAPRRLAGARRLLAASLAHRPAPAKDARPASVARHTRASNSPNCR
ncbi:hypothetical protein D3C86_1205900 [compost metagenome]